MKTYYTRDEVGKFSRSRIMRVWRGLKYGIKVSTFVLGVFSLTGWSILAGYYLEKPPEVVLAATEAKELDIPVLDKIIQCESGEKQFGKDGQVLININIQKDGTKSIDIGVGQINKTVWGKKASEMGYNLMDEKDNMAFTRWLFLNYGSSPWESSSKCWR